MPPDASAIYPSSDPQFSRFPSRRSVVHSTNGIVACTQPLAAQAGQKILNAGGNAADAAVAVAAGMNLTEPASTGIGGDMFCLFYNAKTKQVESINGSGRAPLDSSLSRIKKDLSEYEKSGQDGDISVYSITTPGAAAGWVDTIEKFGGGKLSMIDILTPAISLAEEGFPVSEISASHFAEKAETLKKASPNFGELLKSDQKVPDGKRAPRPGELFYNPTLANTFRLLAEHGKKGFYEGFVADAVDKVVKDLGGYLTKKDLELHAEAGSEVTTPLSISFDVEAMAPEEEQNPNGGSSPNASKSGIKVWEHPPNGQGIVALTTLGILEELKRTSKLSTFSGKDHNSAEYLHVIIEALRIAFADGSWFIADPTAVKVPAEELISRPYLAERARLFDPSKATVNIPRGNPAHQQSDTVYFATTDKEGNACSFINSNYKHFGTGIVPKGCGFPLHCRGANFSLEEGHPNVYAPGKRPYHTIIPSMITNAADDTLHTVFGVMGGFMQPQGQVQVLMNMLVFKFHPQAALDAPRICIGSEVPDEGSLFDKVYLEEGISEEVAEQLRRLGHDVAFKTGYKRSMFGRGQVIRHHMEDGRHVYSAGSDPRGDGAAFPV